MMTRDTPEQDGFIAFARRMGIIIAEPNDYGLSLTLGGGEVTVFDMTSAFSIFANNGQRVEPVAITRIEDYAGNLIFEAGHPSASSGYPTGTRLYYYFHPFRLRSACTHVWRQFDLESFISGSSENRYNE